jgi:hypothetical protein
MSLDIETIYGLLPAIYRTRDAAVAETLDDLLTADEQEELRVLRAALSGGGSLDATQQRDLARLEEKRVRGPLKALLSVIAEQVAGLEENIAQLYDDQFVETCADWAVPYIADLIGYRALDPRLQNRLGSARAEVANTIRFRRRKGTAAVLEDLAVSITGWDAAVVEFFLRLATTQYLNHVRPDNVVTADLRRVEQLEAIGSPFDRLAHTADVRRIASGRGRYNIPNLGIFLWRVGSQRLTDSPAFRVDARRYMFDPLGANTRLYNAAQRATEVTRLAEPLDVPLPIGRRTLRSHVDELYGPGRSLSIRAGNRTLLADEIEACDLSDIDPDPQTSAWAHTGQTRVAVDPVLGRIAFPDNTDEPVLVTYHYGSLARMGGGEYDRASTTSAPGGFERSVPRDLPDVTQALGDLNGSGVVEITDNGRYEETPELAVAANARLEVRAANERRPFVRLGGDLVVSGGDSGEVTLDGLLIAGGRVLVPAEVNGQPNLLQRLRLVHCTLVPGGGLTRDGSPASAALSLEVEAPDVIVEIVRCVVGPLRVAEGSSATISHSIVDGLGQESVAYAGQGGVGGALTVESCTIVGKVRTAVLAASNTIFHAALAVGDTWSAPVIAERRQTGYVRYSFVPVNALVPPRFACQPRTAQDQIGPRFASLRYGQPGYCQLHAACPREIGRGAADEGEMGAFHDLFAPQREDGLRARLDEYLRFGLEAGLFFAS